MSTLQTPPVLSTHPPTLIAPFTPSIRTGTKRVAAFVVVVALAFSLGFITRHLASEPSPTASATPFLPPMIVTPLTTVLALY